MEKDNTKLALRALILLVVFLSVLVLYAFVLKPMINGYVVSSQNQGVEYAIVTIVNEIQQKGFIEIPVGNETLILVQYQPPLEDINIVG